MFPWETEDIQALHDHDHDQRLHHFLCCVRNRVQKADWQLGTWPLATVHLEIPMPRSLYFPSMMGGNSAVCIVRIDTRSFTIEEEVKESQ